ncbi:MAG TPA: hypothetical protein DCM02_12510 [Flavobacterium sp.]|nr:hypothetical protein [Flavobacterium sp.]HAT76470.1 hypothetical protein [Flavobacterium sp.]HAT79953.1 hypothetical protein [Flavobacterium sp.]
MTTLTIKIDKRTKAGKEFMAMSEPFFNNVEGIEIVETNSKEIENEYYTYSPEFKEKIKRAQENIKRGEFVTLNPNDIWGSLGLK